MARPNPPNPPAPPKPPNPPPLLGGCIPPPPKAVTGKSLNLLLSAVMRPIGREGLIIPSMGNLELELMPRIYPPLALLSVFDHGYGPAIFCPIADAPSTASIGSMGNCPIEPRPIIPDIGNCPIEPSGDEGPMGSPSSLFALFKEYCAARLKGMFSAPIIGAVIGGSSLNICWVIREALVCPAAGNSFCAWALFAALATTGMMPLLT